MTPETILLRQAHPNFLDQGQLTSQVFIPFPKDDGKLSVYDGDRISAADSYEHYTRTLKNSSGGVWGVSCSEVTEVGLASLPVPLDDFPSHAAIDFSGQTDKNCRKLAKRLKAFALKRQCLYPA
jgi:hypothetical protein